MIFRSIDTYRHRFIAFLIAIMICGGHFSLGAVTPDEIFDLDAAMEYCSSQPLRSPEGIWIYPEDGVTVLILRSTPLSPNQLPSFEIKVVDSSDVRLHPGDIIGHLHSTPESNRFKVELFTERHNNLLLRPKTIFAKITDEGETMILKREKSKFNFRFTFNPSTLLPKFWRIIRMNSSVNPGNNEEAAVGMIKIYPSYDGNGSSRRQPRYL